MIQPHKITWVLVCDGARARIFETSGAGTGLSPVREDDHPASRARTSEQGTDRPGRTFQSVGDMRSGMAPRVDWQEFEKEKFAREMADVLDAAAKADRFDQVVLIAPPATLGELRKALGKAAAGRVIGEIDKDLTHHRPEDVAGHIDAFIKT